MYIKNVTQEQIEQALNVVNGKYDGNILFNRCERSGRRWAVTLRTKVKSKRNNDDGVKRGYSGRLTTSACWHVHGDFLDALMIIEPEVEIKSLGRTINVNGGNWHDWNAGSIIYPQYMSEMCDCGY